MLDIFQAFLLFLHVNYAEGGRQEQLYINPTQRSFHSKDFSEDLIIFEVVPDGCR